ncbi:DUF6692 family protein [Pseudooceanicola sp. 502str34]
MVYTRFFLMIVMSTALMLGLMYLNTYLVSHMFWSETRAYMALVMGAVMAFVMLAFMLGMYKNRSANIAIFAGSILVFAGSLWLVRSQTTVQDRSYMSAMIPHHSIAIMTSSRANLTDPRVRELADSIVYAQDKEIAEMRYLLADIAANGEAQSGPASPAPKMKDAAEALSTEVVQTVDPEFLTDADIAKAFHDGGVCRFTYTETSPPVLVIGNDSALIRMSGDLVRLEVAGDGFVADPLKVQVNRTDDEKLQDLLVTAGPDYSAGFRGQLTCAN